MDRSVSLAVVPQDHLLYWIDSDGNCSREKGPSQIRGDECMGENSAQRAFLF